jgi:hypothetical protein
MNILLYFFSIALVLPIVIGLFIISTAIERQTNKIVQAINRLKEQGGE